MAKLISAIIISSIVITAFFAAYGTVQLYTRSDRIELIETQQHKIDTLELKVYELRRVHDLTLILEQILTPLQKLELEALNEAIKQGKIKAYKGKENGYKN